MLDFLPTLTCLDELSTSTHFPSMNSNELMQFQCSFQLPSLWYWYSSLQCQPTVATTTRLQVAMNSKPQGTEVQINTMAACTGPVPTSSHPTQCLTPTVPTSLRFAVVVQNVVKKCQKSIRIQTFSSSLYGFIQVGPVSLELVRWQSFHLPGTFLGVTPQKNIRPVT